MKRLENKVAIVTGGAGGIGSAVVARLVSEGAKVVVADINLEIAQQVAKTHGENSLALQFDAADEASIESLIKDTVKHFGRLDILNNNAAITDSAIQSQDTTAVDIPVDIWQQTLEVNLTSYLLTSKYAIPHMCEGGYGSIINIASGSGIRGDLVRIAYGTSKAGVITLSKYIATQHGHQNVRCNTIAPGLIVTPALERTAPEIKEIMAAHTLTPRLGLPEDIAALVAFLAAEESGYITGECIEVNGGTSAAQPHYCDFPKV
jgi:NAD(P)-dependent dehydrogenase (short-subunit alcohol dehydrogenase family)